MDRSSYFTPQNIHILINLISSDLSIVDLICFRLVCRATAEAGLEKFIIKRVKTNLIRQVSSVLNFDLIKSEKFVTEISRDVFFFGSALLFSILEIEDQKPKDIDMITVLNKEYLALSKVMICENGYLKRPIDTTNISLTDMCSLRFRRADFETIENHYEEKHFLVTDEGQKIRKLKLPGESCLEDNQDKPWIRKWFWDMDLVCRLIYGFMEDAENFLKDFEAVVTSPKHKKNLDLVFLNSKKEDIEGAWTAILRTPLVGGRILFGQKDGRFVLRIANPETLQTRISKQNPEDIQILNYLGKALTRKLFDLSFPASNDIEYIEKIIKFCDVNPEGCYNIYRKDEEIFLTHSDGPISKNLRNLDKVSDTELRNLDKELRNRDKELLKKLRNRDKELLKKLRNRDKKLRKHDKKLSKHDKVKPKNLLKGGNYFSPLAWSGFNGSKD